MSSAYSTSTALSSAVLPRCYDRLPPTLSSSRPQPLQPEPVEVSEKAFQGVTPSFYLSSYQLLLIPYGISPTFLASHGHKSMKCYPHRAMFVRQRVAPKIFSTSREASKSLMFCVIAVGICCVISGQFFICPSGAFAHFQRYVCSYPA